MSISVSVSLYVISTFICVALSLFFTLYHSLSLFLCLSISITLWSIYKAFSIFFRGAWKAAFNERNVSKKFKYGKMYMALINRSRKRSNNFYFVYKLSLKPFGYLTWAFLRWTFFFILQGNTRKILLYYSWIFFHLYM